MTTTDSTLPSAFVIGATGLTGRHVVETLAARGTHRVLAHVRPDSRDLARFRERFEALPHTRVVTDAWDEAAMASALEREAPSVVFALLGTTRARASKEGATSEGSLGVYAKVDVGYTELAIRAARALGSPPRFVYLSSIGAGPGARGAYLMARTRVEATLAASGLPYTIARPSFIFGDRDEPRAAEKLGAPVADGALALLGALGATRLRDRYRSITGDALARALVVLALDPAWASRIAEAEDLQRAIRSQRPTSFSSASG